MKPMLLCDGDIYLYNATLASEYEDRTDEDTHILTANYQEAKDGFINQVDYVKRLFNTDSVRIAFTKGPTFRHTLYPDYKHNRVNKRKPLCFARLREEMEETYTCRSYPGLEADDVLGIWATKTDYPTIICSEDKDLQTIPGQLYRQGKVTKISPLEADYFWMLQTLTGDVTDGYPGVRGIGPKKAEKILNHPHPSGPDYPGITSLERQWINAVQAYEDAGLTEADALTQARLARILRASDWDAVKKEVILWTPQFPKRPECR